MVAIRTDPPVPREYPTAASATFGISTDTPTSISRQLKALVSHHLPGVSFVKKVLYFLSGASVP